MRISWVYMGLLRERDKLRIAWNRGEPAVLPIALGSLDALARARNEVPPDVTRTVQRFTAEKHEPGSRYCLNRNLVARRENQKPARLESLAMNVDLSFQEVNPAFVILVTKNQ